MNTVQRIRNRGCGCEALPGFPQARVPHVVSCGLGRGLEDAELRRREALGRRELVLGRSSAARPASSIMSAFRTSALARSKSVYSSTAGPSAARSVRRRRAAVSGAIPLLIKSRIILSSMSCPGAEARATRAARASATASATDRLGGAAQRPSGRVGARLAAPRSSGRGLGRRHMGQRSRLTSARRRHSRQKTCPHSVAIGSSCGAKQIVHSASDTARDTSGGSASSVAGAGSATRAAFPVLSERLSRSGFPGSAGRGEAPLVLVLFPGWWLIWGARRFAPPAGSACLGCPAARPPVREALRAGCSGLPRRGVPLRPER